MAELKIYGLTQKGVYASRNYRLPDEPKYKVLASLYKLQRADLLSICEDTGLSKFEVGRALRQLSGLIATE